MDFIFRDLHAFSGTEPPPPPLFVCRVAVEILKKIDKHIYPLIYDFPYILPQIKLTLKGPKTMAFSKYFSDYNTSSRFIYPNGLIELRSIRMLQISKIIEHEKYFVLLVVVHSFTR